MDDKEISEKLILIKTKGKAETQAELTSSADELFLPIVRVAKRMGWDLSWKENEIYFYVDMGARIETDKFSTEEYGAMASLMLAFIGLLDKDRAI